MDDRQRIPNTIRDPSPCKGCPERFTACSDKCPKEARGEYGYDSWKNEIVRVKNERRKYISRMNNRKKSYKEGEEYGKE